MYTSNNDQFSLETITEERLLQSKKSKKRKAKKAVGAQERNINGVVVASFIR